MTIWSTLLSSLVAEHAPGGQLAVVHHGRLIANVAAGRLSDEPDATEVSHETRFDLASLTKVFVSATFVRLVSEGRVDLDASVREILPDFLPNVARAQLVTWRHCLAHSSGLGQIGPLYLTCDQDEMRREVLAGPLERGTDERILYSDLNLILVGLAVERITGAPLTSALETSLLVPAGIPGVLANPGANALVAPTEWCPWRKRRINGEVHDKNAAAMGGLAGHAGLFGTARDVAILGELIRTGDRQTLPPAAARMMYDLHANDDTERRGLGVTLRSAAEPSSLPFGPRSFGHRGFTGTALWVDPDRELVVALVTNWVYRGREDRGFTQASANLQQHLVGVIDSLPD